MLPSSAVAGTTFSSFCQYYSTDFVSYHNSHSIYPPVTAIFAIGILQHCYFCQIFLQPRSLNSYKLKHSASIRRSGRLFKRLFPFLSGRGTVEQILSLMVSLEFCRDSYRRRRNTIFRARGGLNFTYFQIFKLFSNFFNKSP